MMLPSGRCSSVTRQGVLDVSSILRRFSSASMSCCGKRSYATVTIGEKISGQRTMTSSTGIWRYPRRAGPGRRTRRAASEFSHERGPATSSAEPESSFRCTTPLGELLHRSDADLGYIVAIPHSADRPIGRQQQIDRRASARATEMHAARPHAHSFGASVPLPIGVCLAHGLPDSLGLEQGLHTLRFMASRTFFRPCSKKVSASSAP